MITSFRYMAIPVEHIQMEVMPVPTGMQVVFSIPTMNGVEFMYEDTDSPLDMGLAVQRMSNMAFLIPVTHNPTLELSTEELIDLGALPLTMSDVFKEDTSDMQVTRQDLEKWSLV